MKINDKVKAPSEGKFIPGIVKDVEDAFGFGKRGGSGAGYKYQRVWVEFLDETVKQYRDYDLIAILEEEPKKDKKKT